METRLRTWSGTGSWTFGWVERSHRLDPQRHPDDSRNAMPTNGLPQSIPVQDASILATLAQVRCQLGSKGIPNRELVLVNQMLGGIQASSSKAVAKVLVNGFGKGTLAKFKSKGHAHLAPSEKMAMDLVNWAKS